jgi:hypothetical protein
MCIEFPDVQKRFSIRKTRRDHRTQTRAVSPACRVTVVIVRNQCRLRCGVMSPMATQTVAVPRFNGHSVSIGAGLRGDISPNIGWRVGYDAGIATQGGAVSHGLTAGLRVGL